MNIAHPSRSTRDDRAAAADTASPGQQAGASLPSLPPPSTVPFRSVAVSPGDVGGAPLAAASSGEIPFADEPERHASECDGFDCTALNVALAPFGAGPLCPFCEEPTGDHHDGKPCAHASCAECGALFGVDGDRDEDARPYCDDCRGTNFILEAMR